jgi:small subunit ribosomal protein S7
MRAKKTKRRPTEADKLFNSVKVTKLINRIMKDGKRSVAQKQVYRAFDLIKEKTGRKPVEVFEQALENIQPKMEVRSRRVGGAAYQVPMPVRPLRASSLAIRWLVVESNKRPNSEYKTYSAKLAAEILAALENEGGAIQRRETSHKMAEANKAFAHFRW